MIALVLPASSCCSVSAVQVKDSLRSATLEARLARHPAVTKAAAVRGEAMALRVAARGENNGGRRMDKAKKASALWRMAEDIEAGAVVDVLKRCGLQFTTLILHVTTTVQCCLPSCGFSQNQD